MFSSLHSTSIEPLTDGFVSALPEDLMEENPHLLAAQEQLPALSAKITADFSCMQYNVGTVVPVYNNAAYPMIFKADKITTKGREGQALFDKPGQEYGGENGTRVKRKKASAKEKLAQAQSYRIVSINYT